MTTQVSPPQRRKFLFTMIGGLGALLGAASAWPVFRFLSPIATGGSGDKVTVSRSEVAQGKAHFFQYQEAHTTLSHVVFGILVSPLSHSAFGMQLLPLVV